MVRSEKYIPFASEADVEEWLTVNFKKMIQSPHYFSKIAISFMTNNFPTGTASVKAIRALPPMESAFVLISYVISKTYICFNRELESEEEDPITLMLVGINNVFSSEEAFKAFYSKTAVIEELSALKHMPEVNPATMEAMAKKKDNTTRRLAMTVMNAFLLG